MIARLCGKSAAAAVLLISANAVASVSAPNWVETEPFRAAPMPTGLEWAPDGSNRLFVIGQDGDIRIVQDGSLVSTPFATVTPLFRDSNETGLLGIAFDPDFGTNGFVYVFATVSSSEQQIIRYRGNGNTGADKTVIVRGLPTVGENHNGGAIAFGPDGKLYWAVGNNGGDNLGANADLRLLASKVARANRDGTVPGDNPFDDGNGPNNDFIWARGFRNPFTMAFAPDNERLWVNSVGDNYEQIFVVGAGDHGGYSDHENDQPNGFIAPVIAYRTNGVDSLSIAPNGAVRSGGVSTFTTDDPHPLRIGARVTISGVSNTTFNGSGYVTAVPSPTSFRIAQSGADVTSGGGNVVTADIGACVTGGTFYDSTGAGDAHLGNYFFGDYSSGSLMRVRRNASNVVAVEPFGNLNGAVDIAVGPEGDLYYISNYQDIVYRAHYQASTQDIVVSKSNVRMVEGGSAAFNVRLATAPTGSVTVSVARSVGDADVTISAGASLTFGTNNWSNPQVVRLASAVDGDTDHDSAVLDVSSSGLATRNVNVRVTDPWEGSTGGTGGSGTGGGTTGGSTAGGSGGTSGSDAGGTAGTGDTGGGGASDGGAPDGGATSSGGAGGSSQGGRTQGGTSGTGASGTSGAKTSDDSSGCGCRTGHREARGMLSALVLAGLLLWRRRRLPARRGDDTACT